MQPLSRVNLSEQAATRLVAMMTERGLAPGDLLPNEAELSQLLGIGRSTLREAMRSLAFLGIVEARPGVGTRFVGDASRMMDGLLLGGLLQSRKDIDDLCEARLVLETETARLAALRASTENLKRLRELRVRMEDKSLERAEFVALDLDFHMEIAAASGNAILARLLKATRDLLQEWIVGSQKLQAARPLAWKDHRAIEEAIAAGASGKAAELMSAHLRGSSELLRKSFAAKANRG